MAENQEQQEVKPKRTIDDLFEEMSLAELPLDVENGDGDFGDNEREATFEERSATPKLTDIQSLIKTLVPDLGIDWLTKLQLARVLPEYYNALKDIVIKTLIKSGKNVTEAIALAEVALTSIDGETRIDIIHIGKGAQAEEEKKKETLRGLTP